MLSTIQAKGDGANEKPEAIAVVGISMKMEFDGLVRFFYVSLRFPLHLLFPGRHNNTKDTHTHTHTHTHTNSTHARIRCKRINVLKWDK